MFGTFLAVLPATLIPCPALAPAFSSVVMRVDLHVDEADDAYAFIAGLAEKGLHEVVVREASRFLESYPRHGRSDDVRYALAGARFEMGELEQARPLYERLVGANDFGFPDEARFRLGQCELERGELEAAVAAFEAVRPGYLHVPALYLAGEAYFQGERYQEAAERFSAVRAADRESGEATEGTYAADALHGLAWCALRLEQPAQAVRAAERFHNQYPGDARVAELHFLAGEAHRAAGRNAEALQSYAAVAGVAEGAGGAERVGDAKGVDDNSQRWQEASLRGSAFAEAAAGDNQAAAARFELLLQSFPDGRYAAEAALQRGVQLVLANHASSARQALADQRIKPGPSADYWRGRAALADGDPGAAEEHLAAGLAAEPAEDLRRELASSRADALFELGRTAEAAEAYESAGSPYALHAGAVAHLNDGRAQQAERLARALLNQVDQGVEGADGFAVEGQLVLAEALFAREQYGPAEPVFLAVAEAAGDDEPGADARAARALSRAGWCRYLSAEWPMAEQRFGSLMQRFPAAAESAEACFLSGRCAEEQGNAEAAVGFYDRYVRDYSTGSLRPEALLRAGRLIPGPAGEERLAQICLQHADSELAPDAAVELGDRRAAEERWRPAGDAYSFVVHNAPDSSAVHAARYGLGWVRFRLEDGAGALEILAALVQGEGVPADLLLSGQELRVFAARAAGEPSVAMEAFAAFAPQCEDEARLVAAGEVVGETLVQADALPQARRLYAAVASSLSAPAAVTRMALARLYLDLDAQSIEEAEAQLQVALQTQPDDPAALEAAFFVGEARFAEEADQLAARAYDLAATSPDPEVSSRALYKAGFARLRHANQLSGGEDPESAANAPGFWTRAGQSFQALVEDHPQSELYGEGLFLGGECAYRRGDLEATRAWMQRLLADRPSHATRPKALFRLGVAQAKQGMHEQAAQTLASLRQETPGFEGILEAELWRGKALMQLGDMRASKQALERVCNEDRGVLSAQAYLALGQVAQLEQDLDEALSQYLKVAVLYALDDEVAEALFRAGQVLEAKKDGERARDQYTDAARRFPETVYGAQAAQRLAQISR